ncbi:2-oxoisovalerate dehydrogenase E1 component [Sphingomonas sp. YR710]|uniref:alpha-ketoacid dehydrogenase subunit alpha/beta n=1 Tax=Sphingomonas sp. YR710 TaxID=1882773 RepID=UPI00089155C9|nr:dehydrogenase E1 component subunit alpha/beta [Sphingomonas sp. YR710]SDD83251.1 2-oxoisovalerate dehydrogenase E1 component [Sphingomonas sp. YR710]
MTQSNLGVEPEVLMAIYRQMARIAAVDKAVQAGLSAGKFTFSYWPMGGQECIPATISQLTTTRDYMVTTYRGVHDQVAKGVALEGLFAEMLGRQDGVNKGKGGSPHISDPSSGSMLTTGIVGAGAPIANGLAIAAQERKEDRVTIVNFGDGATSIGAVHEAMNLAGAWKLPIIFLCQNNQYGEYTRIPDYTASTSFAARAEPLGFRGVRLDGNDPIAFYNAMKEVIGSVRAGNGPVFVEALTYRLGPHAGVGDNNIAPAEELAAAKANAPRGKTRALLLETGVATEDQLAAIDDAARTEVDAALAKAMTSVVTPASETLTDVFADIDCVPRRGYYPLRPDAEEPTAETQVMMMFEAVRDAQDLAMAQDPEVFLLGEDVADPPGGVFATSKGLQKKHGATRVRPTPIAEQSIIGAAIGSSLVGMRPIAEIMFADFMGVCLDQIANHAAKQRYMSGSATHAPLTIRMLVGGGTGGFGAQHSQSLEAWLLHTPGLKVAFPSNAYDAKGLLLSCIFDEDPCVHLESIQVLRGLKQPVPLGDYRIPFGVAKVRREGSDITLISYGWQVNQCLTAAEELAKEGISAEVIDLRTLVPLDYARVLDSVKKTGRALVVHAATEFCGLGAEICSTVNEELWGKLKSPAVRLGADYAPIAYSKDIETAQIPHAGSIAARVRGIINQR